MRSAFIAVLTLSAVACGSDPKPPPEAPPPAPVAEAPAPAAPQSEKPGDDPARSSINISDEIRKACGISDTDAHFDYDSANVRPQDKVILKKLADCFATGPLKGRQMKLVGHADPRGEEEYNMVLGGRRADNIKSAIAAQGLDQGKMATTSRGELEASGTDEPGWSKDRRVDIMLGN